jgi:hypothetical protein
MSNKQPPATPITITLTPKQHLVLLDVLTEARAVAQQVSTLCNPSQKKRHLKQAKDIQLIINKTKGA